MCTDKCGTAGLTRRAALFGAAAVAGTAATTAVAAPAQAATAPGFGRGRGLRDLTYPFTTSFPAFAAGEESQRSTYVTIEDDGYYMQECSVGHVHAA